MNCPVCLEPLVETYGRMRWEMDRHPTEGLFHGKLVGYRPCPSCGLVAKTDLPDEDDLQRYYAGSWQYSEPRPGYDKAAKAIARGVSRSEGTGKFPLMVSGSEVALVGDGTLLDVGSKGDKLTEALQAEGILVTSGGGVDAQAREGVSKRWLGKGDAPPENHALVSATHVLEHVLNPRLFMHDLVALTAPGGYIYVEVPSLRGGIVDVGFCDDVNRNHLWHFGLCALMQLGSLVGTVTLLETDTSLPGWPVDRMVVKRCRKAPEAMTTFGMIASDIDIEYEKAGALIRSRDPRTTALYGASHSYALLLETNGGLLPYRVFDQHKAGMSYKTSRGKVVKIEDPHDARRSGIERLYVTSRSWNSYIDIKRWLNLHHPWAHVETPYMSLAQALKEGEFHEGPL